MKDLFRKIAARVSSAVGSVWAFLFAFGVVIIWAVSGPLFDFSATWQLVINTCTTIVTFLMIFIVQNTQNRDDKAVQLKLDELIRASGPARDNFLDLEDMTDDDLFELDQEFKRLRDSYENQAPASVHKLHSKITEAHKKRRSRA